MQVFRFGVGAGVGNGGGQAAACGHATSGQAAQNLDILPLSLMRNMSVYVALALMDLWWRSSG